MKTFEIEIMETLSETIKIEADSVEDAIIAAKKLYQNETIVLDYSNHVDTTIELLEDNMAQSEKKGLIDEVLEHFLQTEKKHFEEYDVAPTDHIYLKLLKLKTLNRFVFPI